MCSVPDTYVHLPSWVWGTSACYTGDKGVVLLKRVLRVRDCVSKLLAQQELGGTSIFTFEHFQIM